MVNEHSSAGPEAVAIGPTWSAGSNRDAEGIPDPRGRGNYACLAVIGPRIARLAGNPFGPCSSIEQAGSRAASRAAPFAPGAA
jgi:hypothetical protein